MAFASHLPNAVITRAQCIFIEAMWIIDNSISLHLRKSHIVFICHCVEPTDNCALCVIQCIQRKQTGDDEGRERAKHWNEIIIIEFDINRTLVYKSWVSDAVNAHTRARIREHEIHIFELYGAKTIRKKTKWSETAATTLERHRMKWIFYLINDCVVFSRCAQLMIVNEWTIVKHSFDDKQTENEYATGWSWRWISFNVSLVFAFDHLETNWERRKCVLVAYEMCGQLNWISIHGMGTTIWKPVCRFCSASSRLCWKCQHFVKIAIQWVGMHSQNIAAREQWRSWVWSVCCVDHSISRKTENFAK